jgi:hypothetical protein
MAEEKSLVLAMILSFFLSVGNVINGLTTRGIVSLVIAVVLDILTLLTGILGILAFIFWVYVLYDTYVCNKAVNEGTEIPQFLFFLDLE